MKICMFTNTYLPHVGGVARSVSFFTEDLRRLGHDVLVVAPEYDDEGGRFEDDEDVLRLPAIQNFNGSDFSVRLPVPFLIDEKVREFEPDIIHSHHPYLLGDAALRMARKYRGAPGFHSPHPVRKLRPLCSHQFGCPAALCRPPVHSLRQPLPGHCGAQQVRGRPYAQKRRGS